MQLRRIALLLASLCSGCATLTGSGQQRLQIQIVDDAGQAVSGMHCHISGSGVNYVGDSPLFDLQVERAFSDLRLDCRRGQLTARGTAISRSSGALAALLPGGTAMLIVDHLTGYTYSYPAWIQLRIGQDLVFDANNDVAGRPTPSMQAEH